MYYESFLGGMSSEEVMHYLPGGSEASYYYVGLHLGGVESGLTCDLMEMGCCQNCVGRGRVRRWQIVRIIYGDFQSWTPAMRLLVKEHTPSKSIITSFSMSEGMSDASTLEE
ncbi:hypothetical protein T439DRAFT_323905 [Meredithblackwellia eburnea MCA 4105]